jgi:hypothetical protein
MRQAILQRRAAGTGERLAAMLHRIHLQQEAR